MPRMICTNECFVFPCAMPSSSAFPLFWQYKTAMQGAQPQLFGGVRAKKINQRANTATTARDSCCVDSAGARQRSAIEKTKRLLRGSNPGPPAKNVGVMTTRPSSLAKWHANVQLNRLKFAEKTNCARTKRVRLLGPLPIVNALRRRPSTSHVVRQAQSAKILKCCCLREEPSTSPPPPKACTGTRMTLPNVSRSVRRMTLILASWIRASQVTCLAEFYRVRSHAAHGPFASTVFLVE